MSEKKSKGQELYDELSYDKKNYFEVASEEEKKAMFGYAEGYKAFLAGETRYSSLVKTQGAEVANKLFEETEESAKERLEGYKKLAGKE